MAFADHIFVKRLGYTHHGIDLGDGRVIHYTGEVAQKSEARIRQSSVGEFAAGGQIRVCEYGECDPPEVVAARARERLHEDDYSLIFNNCEHFAIWCKTGVHRSHQVEDLTSSAGGAVLAGSAAVGSIGVVSATGAVVGLNAAGAMSGLATIGGAVGGGAVAGIVAAGAAPAALAVLAMRRVLRDDPILHEGEREARQAGRTASLAGVAVGSVGAVGAVSSVGTVAGLSAAGIASGLASVGSLVGGGMVAGVAVGAAAPAVASAAAGYAVYRAWKAAARRARGDGKDGEADVRP